MLTAEQCRAARALLDWTQEDLAERAGVSRSTIRGFESGKHALHNASDHVIRHALEQGGALFLEAEDDLGVGVRLKTAAPETGEEEAPRN